MQDKKLDAPVLDAPGQEIFPEVGRPNPVENTRYWFHPESNSYFTTDSEYEVEKLMKTQDGALCNEITLREYLLELTRPEKKPVLDPTEPMQFEPRLAGADLSPDGVYRYYLWRRWKETGPHMLWVMLNPSSTADAEQDDQTIRRVQQFSKREGAASCGVLNLSAFRSFNPRDLYDEKNAGKALMGIEDPMNMEHMRYEFNAPNLLGCVLAWGAHGTLRWAGRQVFNSLTALNLARQREARDTVPLLCLGLTKHGQPRHPLRLNRNAPLIPYTLEAAAAAEMSHTGNEFTEEEF